MTNVETKIAVKNQFERELLDKLAMLNLPSFIKGVKVRRQRASFGCGAKQLRAVYFKGNGIILDLNIAASSALVPIINGAKVDIQNSTQANDFIETTGLKGLDDSAKLKSLEAEKASMKLRIREGTDLETLFKEGINKGNATQILDLAFKQAVASGPITLGIMATTVMTGGGYAAMGVCTICSKRR
jgi:hypothetical protein